MKAFKLTFLILLTIGLGCTKNDAPSFDPDDLDADGVFSSEFTNSMYRDSQGTSHNYSYGIKNFQSNGFPTLGYQSDFSYNYAIQYYYKN
ncbi:hypothetical protein MC378_08260 [Polaribacter sp. MSW13]|uniref:Uncharacterized protein n=1 Tax=Polaribacter marinus TaxID=2916838 RepID=A0A9X1VN07_9FLAO|nr:hypothetical protein [Polaribacter marinus]MCI2229157.1 hypothetical protein [Polaribacter marinus]